MALEAKVPVQKSTFKSGNEMAALAASQINFHLMGYYPITPSTEIAEFIDEMRVEGENTIAMVAGDGEHGAAGICYGAAVAGAGCSTPPRPTATCTPWSRCPSSRARGCRWSSTWSPARSPARWTSAVTTPTSTSP